jgi:hypothetical protein
MKIRTAIRVTLVYSPSGMSTAESVCHSTFFMIGTISVPVMPQVGDEIRLNRRVVDTMCKLPSKLTLDGIKPPCLKVEDASFDLDDLAIAHPRMVCRLDLRSNSDCLSELDRSVWGSYVCHSDLGQDKFIVAPLEQLGFQYKNGDLSPDELVF